ncbi:MAG: hypothetical protein K8I60_16835 [Anaerolineae bacterium]|nr:hypothetical protein [Anaerolineae bacterium]
MKSTRIAIVVLLMGLFVLGLALTVASDGRINVVRHFGGDALYCQAERGCWVLNTHGELLWEVPQADITAAFDRACQTGEMQSLAAGNGTYGPMTLQLNCYDGIPPYLNLIGYDEYYKPNDLQFAPEYSPDVVPTPAPTPVPPPKEML